MNNQTLKNNKLMAFLSLNWLQIFNIKDESFQAVLNQSFLFKTFFAIRNGLQSLFNNVFANSVIIAQLDNFFFFLLLVLLFAIPFSTTSILGAISALIILLGLFKIIFINKTNDISAFHAPVVLYLSVIILSVAFSFLFLPSLKGLAKMLIYIGLYFSFFEFLKSDVKRIKYVIYAILLSGSLEVACAIKQNIFGVEAIAGWQDKTNANPEDLLNRVYGTLKPYNPNLLAGYLLAVIPAMLGSVFLFLKEKQYLKVGFAALASLLAMYSVILTGSRGAYVALFFVLVAFTLIFYSFIKDHLKGKAWVKKVFFWGVIFSVLGIVGLVATSPAIQHRFASIFAMREDSSSSYRMNVYTSTWKMFLDNWLIGIGPGNTTFRLTYGLYMQTGFDALGAYCIFLEMLAESGIFAFFAFVWLVLLGFARFLKKFFSNDDVTTKIIVCVPFIAILGMLVHGMVDTIWYRPQVQILFWLYLAVLAIITTEEKKIN